ncbi:MAG: GGDEF domain-containing protein [Hyphomicrobium sp.]
MKQSGPKALIAAIAEHPWGSARDFIVLCAVMLFCVLLTEHYDVFGFLASLAHPRRGISPAEALLLGVIGALGVWFFISRRLVAAEDGNVSREVLATEMRVLRRLAMQDPLTNLPNRRVLLESLEAATKVAPPEGRSHAVFLLDLNGFKHVNDRYGHAAGDEVLQAVVSRFRRVARSKDVFARLGGDEFAVLSRNVDETSARDIGERFIDSLHNEINAGGATHAVGVAIGAALFPNDGDSVEKVLRHADVAMYRAKAEPSSSLVFFSTVAIEEAARKATG